MAADTNDWISLASACLRGQPYFGPALNAAIGRPPSGEGFDLLLSRVDREPRSLVQIVEVGSWVGQSAIEWVNAGRRTGREVVVHMIDPWRPYHAASGNNSEAALHIDQWLESGLIYDLMCHNVKAAGVADSLRVWRGTLLEVEEALPWSDTSIVYIDGSHVYDDVKTDLNIALKRLPSHGIICGDDLETQISVEDVPEVADLARESPDFIRHPKFGAFHPGVSLAVRELLGEVHAMGPVWWHIKE